MLEKYAAKLTNWLMWVILSSIAVATVLLFFYLSADSKRIAQVSFDYKNIQVRQTILQRMISYRQMLRGGVGLFESSGDVTRQEWKTYIATLQLHRVFPGILGVGYTVYLPADKRSRLESKIRNDGFRSFKVWPEYDRPVYTSIIYLEPFSGRNLRAFGYDMFTEPVRHEAMSTARDSGKVAVSGKVTLVQETEKYVQAGFLMYMPVYAKDVPLDNVQQRRNAIQGFVYSPFRMNDLMSGILGNVYSDLRLKIYDGAKLVGNNILYDSNPGSRHNPVFRKLMHIQVDNRIWSLEISSLSGFEKTVDRSRPLIILFAGIIISILLYIVMRTLNLIHARALELSREIQERKRTEEKLNKTLRELERSNKELEEFAYVASHDLQEPLRMVASYTQLISRRYKGKLDETADEFLDYASEGALRMKQLIHDLLEYSRVTTKGKNFNSVDCNKILEVVLKNLRIQIEHNKAVIKSTGLPVIMADDTQMIQLFQNLISNAIKFKQQIPPEIHVSAVLKNNFWLFSFRDNGIGIDPTFRERIFIIFQRLHEKSEYPGTGIGLSVCKKIVQRHGGDIWVESELHKGSTFYFTVPNKIIL